MKLRVAIIGLGWFGKIHFEAWREVPGVQVVALCDPDVQQFDAARIAKQDSFHAANDGHRTVDFGTITKFSCLDDLILHGAFDLLDIVTPEITHHQIAMKALAANKDVVIEKPVAMSTSEASELLQEAQKYGKQVFVGNILRFDIRYRMIAETVLSDGLTIRFMSFQRHFQSAALQVYGRVHPLFGACIHDIDLALWLMGRMPQRVLASSSNAKNRAYPDSVVGILVWDDGAQAVIQNSWHLTNSVPGGFLFESAIHTDTKTFSVRNNPSVEIDQHDAGHTAPELNFWPSVEGRRSGAIVEELKHFSQCSRRGIPSEVISNGSAIAGIAIAEALLRSEGEGTWIEP